MPLPLSPSRPCAAELQLGFLQEVSLTLCELPVSRLTSATALVAPNHGPGLSPGTVSSSFWTPGEVSASLGPVLVPGTWKVLSVYVASRPRWVRGAPY